MIAELMAVLANAGTTPDSNELRDALWLAGHIAVDPDGHPEEPIAPPDEPVVAELDAETHGEKELEPDDIPPDQPPEEDKAPISLYVGGQGGPPRMLGQPERVQGITVQRPHTVQPARQIEIAKALRPFGRRFPARTRLILDENATITRITEEGVWSPVLRPATERWLSLSLVVDPSPTMAIWRDRIQQFRTTTERLGLFRLLREHPIDRVLAEPANRQAILLITDGIGEDWHDGRMHALLDKWGNTRPVAVCNVLPPQMWSGTGIGVVRGQARSWHPGAANREWAVRSGNGSSAIPVVRFSAPWLASWSRLVAGTSSWTPVALLDSPPATAVGQPTRDPRELVERFRLGASPQAFRLACLLGAAWLTLPVIRLVRDLMLPEADDGDLAQFLLGGLLRSGPPQVRVDPDNARYDFLPGVREHLLSYLQRRDLLTVVEETSRFVASKYKQGFDVAALLADPENALRGQADIDTDSPLYVAVVVLAQLGGRYRALKPAAPSAPKVTLADEITDPMPRIPGLHRIPSAPKPLEDLDPPTDRMPIYEAVLSQWFVPDDQSSRSHVVEDATPTETPASHQKTQAWPTPITRFDNPSASPTLLDNRYELTSELASGSLSQVYQARDLVLARTVAVKMLRSDLAHDRTFQEHFWRQARHTSTLDHPAIVTVYNTNQPSDRAQQRAFIVMEHVDGLTLEEIVAQRGPLPQWRAMKIAKDLCAALDFLHRRGILHRDVKPANLMVTRSGSLKLVGFSYSCQYNGRHVAYTDEIDDDDVYQSPELLRGESIDFRHDVHAAGHTLFVLLTGEPPHSRPSPAATATRVAREAPPAPSEINPAVSPRVDQITLKALAVLKEDRYRSAGAMFADIDPVLTLKPLPPRDEAGRVEERPQKTRRRWWFGQR